MANARTLNAASTGHPFRRTLKIDSTATALRDDHDLKLFALSFTAFFVCIYSFIF